MFGCLEPREVRNKYTGAVVRVACGSCSYCLVARSAKYSSIVAIELLRNAGTTLFVTLTYENKNIPLYKLDGACRAFVSNRAGFPPIPVESVDKVIVPNGLRGVCFGHLCYSDVQQFHSRLRALIYKYCRRNSLPYESRKYKYFVCGEYGPYSARPHYHLLLFFPTVLGEREYKEFSEIVSSCWPSGRVDLQPVTTSSVGCYLSTYVNSLVSLPKVYGIKSLRPFVKYSTLGGFGYYRLDDSEILEILQSGSYERFKYDKDTGELRSEFVPPSFFARYFPKCTGFGSLSNRSKLYVYGYAFRYFEREKVVHDLEDLAHLSVGSVDWSVCLHYPCYQDKENDIPPRSFSTWTYKDKRASLMCYIYCVKFGLLPWQYLEMLERLYTSLFSRALCSFYEALEDKPIDSNRVGLYSGVRDYVPKNLEQMDEDIYDFMEGIGFDLGSLYKLNGCIDEDVLKSWMYDDNSYREAERLRTLDISTNLVKSKKMNDYKNKKQVRELYL